MYRFIRHTATNCGKRTVAIYLESDRIAFGEGLLLSDLLTLRSFKLLRELLEPNNI